MQAQGLVGPDPGPIQLGGQTAGTRRPGRKDEEDA
jgi:hypothetical protein